MSQLAFSDSIGTWPWTRSKKRARSVTCTPFSRHSSSERSGSTPPRCWRTATMISLIAQPAHRVLERADARDHAVRRNGHLLDLLERVEADEVEPWRIGRRERRLDDARLGARAEHEHAARQEPAHDRRHDQVPHDDEARESRARPPRATFVEVVAARQHASEQIRDGNADQRARGRRASPARRTGSSRRADRGRTRRSGRRSARRMRRQAPPRATPGPGRARRAGARASTATNSHALPRRAGTASRRECGD